MVELLKEGDAVVIFNSWHKNMPKGSLGVILPFKGDGIVRAQFAHFPTFVSFGATPYKWVEKADGPW